MRTILFLPVIFLFPLLGFAQDLTGVWEAKVKDNGRTYLYSVNLFKTSENRYAGVLLIQQTSVGTTTFNGRGRSTEITMSDLIGSKPSAKAGITVLFANDALRLHVIEVFETKGAAGNWQVGDMVLNYSGIGRPAKLTSGSGLEFKKKKDEFPSEYSDYLAQQATKFDAAAYWSNTNNNQQVASAVGSTDQNINNTNKFSEQSTEIKMEPQPNQELTNLQHQINQYVLITSVGIGWKFINGSIHRITINARSDDGQPSVVRAYLTALGDAYENGNWVELLLDHGTAYYLRYWSDEEMFYTPQDKPGHLKDVYTAEQLNKIKQLQEKFDAKFLQDFFGPSDPSYNKVIKEQKKIPSTQDVCNCLVDTSYLRMVTSSKPVEHYESTVTGYDLNNGNAPIYGTKTTITYEPETETISNQGLKNNCPHEITIRGILCHREDKKIWYENISKNIKPGEIIEYIELKPSYDRYKEPFNQPIYFDYKSTEKDYIIVSEKFIPAFVDKVDVSTKAIYQTAITSYKAKNYKQAYDLFVKISNYAPAQHFIADFYYNGFTPAQQSYSKSLEWELKAALQGYDESENDVGYIYDHGNGVDTDYEAGYNWVKKAALQGFARAETAIAVHYIRGLGVDKNFEQALLWYNKALVQDDDYAQYQVGLYYYNGEGVAKDIDKGADLIAKAAHQGNTLAIAWCKNNGVKY